MTENYYMATVHTSGEDHHLRPFRVATIDEAKDQAARILRNLFADQNRRTAPVKDREAAVQNLIEQVTAATGPVTIIDDSLWVTAMIEEFTVREDVDHLAGDLELTIEFDPDLEYLGIDPRALAEDMAATIGFRQAALLPESEIRAYALTFHARTRN